MPQGDEETGAVEEALKHGKDAVVAHLDAAEVLQPGVGALDFPAFAIAAQLALVFKTAVADVFAIGDNQLASTLFEPLPQGIGIVAAIGNHPSQAGARTPAPFARNPHRIERALRQPALGQLRGRKLRSDRYALAVDHHHALRTFPTTRFADRRAPFFAVMKVASRKASSQSSRPLWSSRESSFCHALSQTSCSSQARSRRQQVDPSGYSSGISRHRAPVRKIQRIPSRQSRLAAQGRPRLPRFGSGNNGSKTAQWASLSIAAGFFIEEAHQPTCLTRKSLS